MKKKAVASTHLLKRPTAHGLVAGVNKTSGTAGISAWEERLWHEGFAVVAGTDEAGRGPLAGPVVAAAFEVIAHDDPEVRNLLTQVADSKKMSAEQRDHVYKQ